MRSGWRRSTSSVDDLDELVCCDDAFPYHYVFDCGGSGSYVSWSDGFCASLRGNGLLAVELTFDHGLPASTAALVTRQVLTDGEPGKPRFDDTATAFGDKPFCTEVVLHNLATGETVTSAKQCHGDALVDQLGPQMLDPSDQLAEKCTGPAYVCDQAAGSGSWDMNKCTPWPPESPTTGETEPTGGPQTTGDDTGAVTATGDDGTGDTVTEDDLGDRGCSCNGGTPGGLGALAIAGLALLRRRRVRCPA